MKETKKEMVKVGSRITVTFQVDKKAFLDDANEAIKEALYDGKATFDGDGYCPGDWNRDITGDSWDVDYWVRDIRDIKLPLQAFTYINNRAEQLKSDIEQAKMSDKEGLMEIKTLQAVLSELEKIQSLIN